VAPEVAFVASKVGASGILEGDRTLGDPG